MSSTNISNGSTSEGKRFEHTYTCEGIDPDPLTLYLNWLGAIGSVASIVSWYEQNREARHERWQREMDDAARYKCFQKITDVESDIALLGANIDKINLLLLLAQGGTVNGEPMMIPESLSQAPLQFGSVRLVLTDNLMKEFMRFHKETLAISKHLGTNIITLVQELSRYKIVVGSETAHYLIEFREHLNSVLQSGNYQIALAQCPKTIEMGRNSMSALKQDLGNTIE